MDAANPLCRILLAAALAVAIGCQHTDQDSSSSQNNPSPYEDYATVQAQRAKNEATYLAQNPAAKGPVVRPQMPDDPIGPIAPVGPPPPLPNTLPSQLKSVVPASPLGPISPVAPTPGVTNAIPGAPVVGSPVPPDGKGNVVSIGYTGVKNIATAADLLKNGKPQVKVVAIVGANNVITDQEVRESVWQQNEELAKLDGREREAKAKELYTLALRRTIERELILDDMYSKLKKANKMSVVDEIRESAVQLSEKQIREIKKKIGSKTDEDFAYFLKLQGLTLPVLRRQFERQIMAQQYLNSMFREKGRRVGLSEIRDYYDKHPEEFKAPDRVKWLDIFVSFNRHPNAQAAYNHAEGLRQKLVAGADFATVSKQFDEGLAGKQNGLGAGDSRDKILPLDVEPTVWALKPGEMSGLIQTPTGYHIVKVVERDYAGVQPFDAKVQNKIRDKLTDALTEAEQKKLVEDLWRKGVVRVLEE